MNKRLILALGTITILVSGFVVASCAAPTPTPAPTPAPAPAPAPAPTPTPAPEVEVIRWLAQDENPATVSSYLGLKKVNDKIAEASGGRLIIETYAGDAICPADTELDGANAGMIDIGHGAFSTWAGTFPPAPLFNKMVSGPSAMEYYFWFQEGQGMDLAHEMLASKNYNVHCIAVDAIVPEVFLYTNHPITGTEDVKGKKYRMLGDEATIFGKLGISAIATPSGEVYESMQRGVIDGFQMGNLAGDLDWGAEEIVDYAYMGTTRQPTDIFVYFVDGDSWAELPDDLKVLVEELYWREGIRQYGELTNKNTKALPQWEAAGVTIEAMPQSVVDAVDEAAAQFYTEMCNKDPFYKKTYDSLIEWKDAYRTAYPRL